MTYPTTPSRPLLVTMPFALAAVFFFGRPAMAVDVFDPATGQLSIPSLAVGAAVYSGVVVKVGKILSGPASGPAAGAIDSYNPATGQLTVPEVVLGSQTYFNVVVTVDKLLSISSVSGADSYSASRLSIPIVEVGAATYESVQLAVSPADIVENAGGMPQAALDQYTPATGHLLIPAVQAGAAVYTNVTLAVSAGDIVGLGGSSGLGYDCKSSATSVWLPVLVTPISSAGPSGVYVVPCNSLTSTAVPLGGPALTSEFPLNAGYNDTSFATLAQTGLFVATAADGNGYLYRVDFRDTASPPAAVQVSSIPVPQQPYYGFPAVGCSGNYALGFQTNLHDPASLVAEIAMPTTVGGDCNNGTVNQLFSYNGGEPVNVPSSLSGFPPEEPLYDSSGLARGFVQIDSAGNLGYFSLDPTSLAIAEATPALASGIKTAGSYPIAYTASNFLQQYEDSSDNYHWIEVNESGAIVARFDLPAGLRAISALSAAGSVYVVAQPTSAGTPVSLYSMPWAASVTAPLPGATLLATLNAASFTLLGTSADGSVLYAYASVSGSLQVYALAVASGKLSLLGSVPAPNGGGVQLDQSASYLLVSLTAGSASPSSTEVIAINGFTALQALTETLSTLNNLGSSTGCAGYRGFAIGSALSSPMAPTAVLRESNYSGSPSNNVGDSGASFDVLDVLSGADSPLATSPGGASYVVPATSAGHEFYQWTCSAPLGPDIGAVVFASTASTLTNPVGRFAVAYDLLNHLMVPVNVPGADLSTSNFDLWGLQL